MKNLKYFIIFLSVLAATIGLAVLFKQNRKSMPTQYFQPHQTKIAAINIEGPIMNSKSVQLALKNALNDPQIKGVALLINSGGGGLSPSAAVEETLRKVKEKKPIVSVVTGDCCSGAYWIASASNEIICPDGCSVGSIGVYRQLEKHKNLKGRTPESEADIDSLFLSAGKYKGIDHPRKQISKEDLEFLKKDLNKSYKKFCKTVAKNRGLDMKEIDKWAEGQVFFGDKAKKVGLVDCVGSLIDLDDAMKKYIKEYFPNEEISQDLLHLNFNTTLQ